jgi:hypothetical protein
MTNDQFYQSREIVNKVNKNCDYLSILKDLREIRFVNRNSTSHDIGKDNPLFEVFKTLLVSQYENENLELNRQFDEL